MVGIIENFRRTLLGGAPDLRLLLISTVASLVLLRLRTCIFKTGRSHRGPTSSRALGI